MRSRLLLAFAAGTLILAGCSDQTPTEPTGPPAENFGTSCSVTPFPLLALANQIKAIYPGTQRAQVLLRAEALLRAGAIKVLWDTCHPAAARKVAFAFIDWLNRHTPVGKEDQVKALILAILRGIGEVTAPESSGDFGVGFFDPATQGNTLVKTVNGRALVQLPQGSFLEPTVITISRKADNFQLSNFDGRQFPPKYDYNAINASNQHVLQGELTAIVGFCLVELEPGGIDGVYPSGGYPENPRIGHNPVTGAPGFPFEVLDEVNLAEEGLGEDLNEGFCNGSTPFTPRIGPVSSSGVGPSALATAAFRTAARYLGPILMPQPLLAATLDKLPPPPPIGGKVRSLSPFAVVEFTRTQVEPFGTDLGAVGAGPYTAGQPLDTCGECGGPRYRVTDGEVPISTPQTDLSVTLIQGEGSTGVLSGDTQEQTSAVAPYAAQFNDLRISQPGQYQLRVSAPNVTSYTTGVFTVGAAPPPIP